MARAPGCDGLPELAQEAGAVNPCVDLGESTPTDLGHEAHALSDVTPSTRSLASRKCTRLGSRTAFETPSLVIDLRDDATSVGVPVTADGCSFGLDEAAIARRVDVSDAEFGAVSPGMVVPSSRRHVTCLVGSFWENGADEDEEDDDVVAIPDSVDMFELAKESPRKDPSFVAFSVDGNAEQEVPTCARSHRPKTGLDFDTFWENDEDDVVAIGESGDMFHIGSPKAKGTL